MGQAGDGRRRQTEEAGQLPILGSHRQCRGSGGHVHHDDAAWVGTVLSMLGKNLEEEVMLILSNFLYL